MRVRPRTLNERGAAAVLVAVALAALLAMAALAVDVGMLLKVRSDAQRAADAAALAGAQEFMTGKPQDVKMLALDSALVYSARNYVGWRYVDTAGTVVIDSGSRLIGKAPEAYVQVIPDSAKVRVFIRRGATPTWFGHLLGLDFIPISVRAAARAAETGSGKCVKPFAIPDMWSDANDDNNPANRLWDQPIKGQKGTGENWQFDPNDTYVRYQDPNQPNPSRWTGYGSSWRNNNYLAADANRRLYWDDYGRPMNIKVSNPQATPSPGFFYPWVVPYDSSNPSAYPPGLNPGPGASWYRWNISHCNPAQVSLSGSASLDTTELNKPGNMIGPTNQGIDSLVAQDSLACWAEFPDPNHLGYTTGEVKRRATMSGPCDQPYPGWENSPRVAMVPLFDPSQIQSGRVNLTFNNLAIIFIEGQKTPQDPVVARFLFFAKGTGPAGPQTGSLVKKLQLVE